LDRSQINHQVGRLLQRNSRAAARFEIALPDSDTPAGFALRVRPREEFDRWAEISEGAYVLRTNIRDWTDKQLWPTNNHS